MNDIPLPSKSDHEFIRALIIVYFSMHIGHEFHGTTLNRFVFSRMNKYVYPDTIFRYMRELRQEGAINYCVKSHADSIYQVLPL